MTDPTQNTQPDTAGLVARLRKRAADDRVIQRNNETVATALMGQRILFDERDGSHSVFAVRLQLDYENCAKNDAALARDWDEAADALEAATARADKAEADAATNLRLANEAAEVMNRAIAERDAALSRVTEAKAEGMRACEAICDDEARQYSEGHMTESKAFAGSAVRVVRRRIREAAHLAHSSGADPAQGGQDDG